MDDYGKYIKIYGTLVNHTVDTQLSDEIHNDMLSYAKQLYDDQFFPNEKTINNYQDIINKRLTAISYVVEPGQDPCTIIENRDGSEGTPYMLIVNGNTNLNGDVNITGDLNVDGDTHLHDLVVDGTIEGISLDDLDDVTTSGDHVPEDGEYLRYDDTLDQWVPSEIQLTDIEGLDNGQQGDVLTFIDGSWVPAQPHLDHLNDIGDVNAPSPMDGALLYWDASANNGAGEWKPSTTSLYDIVASMLWELVPNTDTTSDPRIQTKVNSNSVRRSVQAAGFYDTTVSA